MNQAEDFVLSCLPSGIINLAQGLSSQFRDHGSCSFFLQFCAARYDINAVITHAK